MRLLSFVLAFGILLACGTEAEPVQAQLGRATVIGEYDASTGVDAFLGIKYANSARFEHAKMVDYPEQKFINATVHAPACAQKNNGKGYDKYGVVEDCLYLEIYRPHPDRFTGSIPVLVWIHSGGGYFSAANRFAGYKFVNQSLEIGMPVMLVTINYRLAAWGFLGGKEASLHKAVNLGLYDERVALEWIQNHIGGFGGDKSKVTLWGLSSGAMHAHFHYLDEKSELFRAAIMSSGNMYSIPAIETSFFQDNYYALVTLTGCNATTDTFSCIKNVDHDVLQNAVDEMLGDTHTYSTRPWGLVVDGVIIPSTPSRLLSQGKYAKKPFLHGSVLDEGTSYVKPIPMDTVDDMWAFFETDYLNKDSTWLSNEQTKERILDLYPEDPADGSPFGTGAQTFGYGFTFKRAAAIYGDVRYHAPRRNWLSDAKRHNVKGWAYQFSQTTPGKKPAYGVSHITDQAYYFLELSESLTEHYGLAKYIVNHWIAFAHNMDPNLKGFPTWPAYGADRNLMDFAINDTRVIPDVFREEATTYLNSVQDQFGNPKTLEPFWSTLDEWVDFIFALPFMK